MMDGMMSKAGLYEYYPLYYIQELKREGRRDISQAFMDYWDDYRSEIRGFGEVKPVRYYAKVWHNAYKSRGKVTIGISPSTAMAWIEDFKEVIARFEAVQEMYENSTKEAMDSCSKKTIEQQSNSSRTKKGALNTTVKGSGEKQSNTNRQAIEHNNKENNNKPSSPKQKFSEDDLILSKKLFAYIKAINPNHKEPNFNRWANDCRLMRECDNRTVENIDNILKWLFESNGIYAKWDGSFWQRNILSMSKLREKYDAVSIQIRSAVEKKRVE